MAFDQRLAECTTLSNSYVQGEIPLDPRHPLRRGRHFKLSSALHVYQQSDFKNLGTVMIGTSTLRLFLAMHSRCHGRCKGY